MNNLVEAGKTYFYAAIKINPGKETGEVFPIAKFGLPKRALGSQARIRRAKKAAGAATTLGRRTIDRPHTTTVSLTLA